MTIDLHKRAPEPGAEPAVEPAAEPVPPRARRRWPSPWHLLLLPTALLMGAPLIWMFLTSVSALEETRRFPPGLPAGLRWHNYVQAWTDSPFAHWLFNSAVVSVTCVITNVVLATLAG